MSDIVKLQFSVKTSQVSLWSSICTLLAEGGSGAKLQDLFDELQADAGDLLDEFFDEFDSEQLYAENWHHEANRFEIELLAGGFGEDLIEALEPIFLQLPVEGFVASLGSDSGS
ncbi:hypothetical protein DU002_11770 [Corallincola holothuriorum]|uniref:Uncharacterized protein n=1 Tax=Corallincola holothuriorum TaxID=2282215 RepID=A0A368NG13_9GAMM|nr:hypothetical protein [Corallincola holothuriorum]RCU49587.1 hypothetical protein DU002_11770 [Corallincola holothuriorum]